MDSELGDDVTEQQMSVIASGGIDAVLTEQTRPGKGHQSAQFVALTFVGRVVDVLRRLFHQQTAELQQQDAYGVRRAEGIVGIDDFVDEDADHAVVVVLVGRRRRSNQNFTCKCSIQCSSFTCPNFIDLFKC